MLQSFLSSGNLFFEREESIVLFIGDGACIAGLSGEDRPRVSLPLALSCRPAGFAEVVVTEASPAAQLDEALEPFLRRLCFSHLQVNVHERKAVLVFPVTATEALREAVCRVLLRLRSPGVALASSAQAAALALGLPTALVVERGGGEVRVVPVVEGAVAPGAMAFAQAEGGGDEAAAVAAAAARAVACSAVDARLALVSHLVPISSSSAEREGLVACVRAGAAEELKSHVVAVADPYGGVSLAWLGGSLLGSVLHKKHAPLGVLKRAEDMQQLGQIG
jgi:hypothetical protein